jgi:GH15 family glucan-1,4-alpha-glucosidase
MTTSIPEVAGVISADEVAASGAALASLQQPDGMIPWFPGGHCDPWNHVESAMALDVCGIHEPAVRAYEWLASTQRSDGSWFNYYRADGSVEDSKLDTNVCAYVAAGVWHHWMCTGDRGFVESFWPMMERALDWVLGMRRPDGLPIWAREVDERPWEYALLTGSSSIWHALHCGALVAELVGTRREDWADAADVIEAAIVERPESFEPKVRWAMDWYYPVLTGVMTGDRARDRLADGWDRFILPGRGVRCVSDEPWVTAAETAECALAHAAIGELTTATELLDWTRPHRHDDGSYWTGLVYPDGTHFPEGERTSYTTAAVILAADAIAAASPAAAIFVHPTPQVR